MSDNIENEQIRCSPVEKKWVQFDETNELKSPNINETTASVSSMSNYNGAVIDTETVQIDIDKLKQIAQTKVPEVADQSENVQITSISTMRNINLDDLDSTDAVNLPTVVDPSIQRGFGNHLLVSLCEHHNILIYF